MADREQYLFQENFLNLVPRTEFNPATLPTRTRSTFWNEDILETAIKLRQIYVSSYSVNEANVLRNAHSWWKSGGVVNDSLGMLRDKDLSNIPEEALFNWETLEFFGMQADFKSPVATFEPFVVYKPGTADWSNDLRNSTFEHMNRLFTRPVELHNKHKVSSRFDIPKVASRITVDTKVANRFESVDTISWVALMQYHLELMKREKFIIDSTFPVKYSF